MAIHTTSDIMKKNFSLPSDLHHSDPKNDISINRNESESKISSPCEKKPESEPLNQLPQQPTPPRKTPEIKTCMENSQRSPEDQKPTNILYASYEGAKDGMKKSTQFISEGFNNSGGQQSVIATSVGLTLFGLGGFLIGGIAGAIDYTMHSIKKSASSNPTNLFQPTSSLEVEELKQLAEQKYHNIKQF